MSNSKTKEKNEQIFIIAGKDASMLDAECQQLIKTLLKPEQKATCLFDADPNKTSACEIFDELRTLPFLAEKRVVLVKNADKFISNNREILEKYFDNPSSTGIFIMTVNSWDSRTRLSKKLPRVGKLLTVTEPKAWQLPSKLIQYANDAHSKNLTKTAAQFLVDLAGENLVQLYHEIDKLALFANKERNITIDHIASLIGHNRLYNAFNVIDAVTAGNVDKAVNRLRKMFAENKSAEYTVVGAFAYHYRRMFNAKILLQKGVPVSEIANKLRLWSNKEKFFPQLRRISLKQIGDSLSALASIDYAIKTGGTKPKIAMEKFVYKLTAETNTH